MAKKKSGWLVGALLLGGLGFLLLGRKAKAAPGSIPSAPAGEPEGLILPSAHLTAAPSGFSAWWKWASDAAGRFVPTFEGLYPVGRLKALTVIATSELGLGKEGAEALWGIMHSETGGLLSAGVAKSANETSIGLIQMLRSRYENSEKPSPLITIELWWDHIDNLNPRLAIWAGAASLQRLLAKRGSLSPQAAGQWWATPGIPEMTEQATRKMNAIVSFGPDVWDYSPSALRPGDDLVPLRSMVESPVYGVWAG